MMEGLWRVMSSAMDAFRDLRADYQAARPSRFRRVRRGIQSLGSNADYHYSAEYDFYHMMELARDMDRNDICVGQGVDRAAVNTLQDGFTLNPQTGDDGLDADLLARWESWSRDRTQCDITQERTFCELEWLVFRHMLVDGDIFAVATENGSLELIEAHRARTPRPGADNIIHGIELDRLRRRLAYHFTVDDISPRAALSPTSKVTRVAAFDNEQPLVFHVYNSKRVSQTRGVTAFHPIFDAAGMFEDINFAKLVQQNIVSCFAIFRMRDVDASIPAGNDQMGAVQTVPRADGSVARIEGLQAGLQFKGAPGERLEGFSPNVPNPEFFDHTRLILTLVGINLGLPLTLFLLDASDTNFSGWRGAVDQARMGFKRNQRMLRDRFHTPTYQWQLRRWIADDEDLQRAAAKLEADNLDIFRHEWNLPTWPYIEPLKDATADLVRVRNCQISPRRMQAERGREWTQVATEIVEDNLFAIRRAKEAARELNAAVPDDAPVTWRDLLTLPAPEGVTVKVGAETEPANDGGGDDE